MMTAGRVWFVLVTVVAPLFRLSSGHGRLLEPPSRSSMWRQGYPSPINYADNQLFCGGFKHQWEDQGGKCGICGDPYDGPRDHEPGGKYYTGIITRTFKQGQVIDIEVELTAFHYGYFEFRLCPLDYRNQTVRQDCFDRYPLRLITPSESKLATRYKLPSDSSTRMVKVKGTLPAGVTCKQCILQWKYHAANSWGTDFITKRGCVGCGAQEEFYGCADITIHRNDGSSTNLDGSPQSVVAHTSKRTEKPVSKSELLKMLINQILKQMLSEEVKSKDVQQDDWSRPVNVKSAEPKVTNDNNQGTAPEPKSLKSLTDMKATIVGHCQATGAWKGQVAIDDWCQLNCALGHCPPSHCVCKQPKRRPTPKSWSPDSGSYNPEPIHKISHYQRPSQQITTRQRSPTKQNHRKTQRSYQQSRSSNRGGPGLMGNTQRIHNQNWRHSTTGSRPPNKMHSALMLGAPNFSPYNQKSFNKIKDQVDNVYRSLMQNDKQVMGQIYTNNNYSPYRTTGNSAQRLYEPRARMYMKRPGQTPWELPNSFISNNAQYQGLHSQNPRNHYFHTRRPNHHNNRYNTINNDRDLIAKAQFVDDAPRRIPGGKSFHPIMASQRVPKQSTQKGQNCIASGAWTGQASMTTWCQNNCALGNCPTTHCRCP